MSLYEKEVAALRKLHDYAIPSATYVAHSGGKDSVVVHHLAKKAFGPNIPVVHTPKISGFNKVHPLTIDFLYEMSAESGLLIVPGNRMKQFLDDQHLSIQIDGTRQDECDRTDRSADVVIDGKTISRSEMPCYTVGGVFGQASVFPIVDWSDDDVWRYIAQEGLKVSEEYNLQSAR